MNELMREQVRFDIQSEQVRFNIGIIFLDTNISQFSVNGEVYKNRTHRKMLQTASFYTGCNVG